MIKYCKIACGLHIHTLFFIILSSTFEPQSPQPATQRDSQAAKP